MSVGKNQPAPDEIPEALRDVTPVMEAKRTRFWLWLGSGVGLAVLGSIVGLYLWNENSKLSVASSPQEVETVTPKTEKKETAEAQTESSSTAATPPDLLGHLPYESAPKESLTPVTADGRIQLRTPAAQAFIKMQNEARREGISLVPLSGFRSIAQQEKLFFGVKAQRRQRTTERAEVSAPPGYSEHHTGYAIDIGDGKAPATHVETSFGETEAFAWLEENAARYSFELSFPENNAQGISYEPWHWRYVGNQESLEIFYKNQSK
ncbi:D-Ala-D-Ala carboxypeptidase [Halothece sp. PCC 7418]|nr:D-Ala-D-Ala carboxypeptidase [Halothece sp. PCC 7418]